MLRSWLRDAGCGVLHETHPYTLRSIDTYEIYQAASVIEVSAGQPAYEAFVQQALRYSQRVKPLLLRTEVLGEKEHDALCDQLVEELNHQDFCGLFPIVRAWAPRL